MTTVTRLEVLPDIPAVAEFVPGYEANGWYGIGAPKRTSTEIIRKLNDETNTVLADPQTENSTAGPRQRTDVDDVRRVWGIHRRRNKKMGKGDSDGRH